MLLGALFPAAPGALAAPPTPSRLVRPWTPPAADSLLAWATEAKARFQTNRGDSIGGTNYRAYELVGRIARRMLRSLGDANAAQAEAMKPVLDSLGLDTEIAVDPATPRFVLMVARNPYRLSATAVGFLFWFRGGDLRIQGVQLRDGLSPRMRVWWTGRNQHPYEWAIVYRERGQEGRMDLLWLGMSADGYYWEIGQSPVDGPDLGGPGEAYWVDMNRDGTPELVTWVGANADSAFEQCAGCPRLFTERIYTRHEDGFSLHDSRLVPSPYATFVLFIRLLREQNRAAASRLLQTPSRLDEAIRLGWGVGTGRGTWKLEYAEDEPWPRWLALRHKGAKDERLYIVHFAMKDARWLISDWKTPTTPGKGVTPGGASQK